MKHNLILIAATSLVFFGCNREPESNDGSSLKTLDNFAGTSEAKVNVCGPKSGGGQLPSDINAPAPLMSTVKATYAAVPSNLHSLVFEKSGSIEISSEAAAKCQAKLSSDERAFAGEDAKPTGCWDVSGNQISLIFDEDSEAIRHGMLRLAGYVYTQLLAEGAKDTPNAKIFRDQRQKLGFAFVEDLRKNHGGMNTKLTKLARKGTQFGDFVLAEAIDSYYCNEDTKSSFKKNFPRTYEAFTSGRESFRSDLGKAFWE